MVPLLPVREVGGDNNVGAVGWGWQWVQLSLSVPLVSLSVDGADVAVGAGAAVVGAAIFCQCCCRRCFLVELTTVE